MPEPRTSRDLQAVPPVQIDAKNRDASAYQQARRHGESGPFRGKPVEIRNGLPFRPYRYQGAGHDTTECTCHA